MHLVFTYEDQQKVIKITGNNATIKKSQILKMLLHGYMIVKKKDVTIAVGFTI